MEKRRALFTPVVWGSAVYLCGGVENFTIEVVNGVTIVLLDVLLPEAGQTLVCVQGDTLLVLTCSFLTAISKGKADRAVNLTSARRIASCVGVHSNPVLWKDIVFNRDGSSIAKYSASDGHRLD